MSEHVKSKAEKYMAHLIRAHRDDPVRLATFRSNSLIPRTTEKRRRGRPRKKWTEEVLQRMWPKASHDPPETPLDLSSSRHIKYFRAAASNYIY